MNFSLTFSLWMDGLSGGPCTSAQKTGPRKHLLAGSFPMAPLPRLFVGSFFVSL